MVEPACRIGYYNLHSSTTCTKEIDREMAIAFYNSDFHSNVHESDEWDDYRYYTFSAFCLHFMVVYTFTFLISQSM